MRRGNTFRSVLLATSALVPLGLIPAHAGPQGGQVVGGSSAISTQGTTTTITQTTDRSVINWQTYNVGANEKVQYVQPNANAISLNRVTGGQGPSSIYGSIAANGQVWIINPAGILIGSGAVVNTAGFLATTNDIKNDDFMAGRYNFIIPGRPDASVVNLGTITATNGGFAALVAPGVRNSGTITAKFGKISLASGNTFSLDFYGDSLITLGVNDSIAGQVKDVATGQTLDALVKNDGLLKANGGKVELTAVAARQVVDSVINNSGVIEARSIGHRNGMIVLGAQTSKTKVAGAPTQTVKVSGTLNVSGKKKGGTVKVTGENIQLASANIKATGGTGGGTVMIGGDTGGGKVSSEVAGIAQAQLSGGPVPTADTVSVDANSVIDVSATKSGDGGKAIVWSDLHTTFAGTVLAKGGAQSGNGGFVEVSGKQTLAYSGLVDTRAANGAFGTLLLDPYNLTITNSPSSIGGFTATANDSILNVDVLTNALATSNVVVTTGSGGTQDGNITIAAPLAWSAATVLTLQAAGGIAINAPININGSGGLSLWATARSGISTTGVTFGNGASVTYAGGGSIGGQTLSINGVGYKLVYSMSDLDGIDGVAAVSGGNITDQVPAGGLAGNYALANNIVASAAYTQSIVGSQGVYFTGRLDGLGHTISGLTINAPTTSFVALVSGLSGVGASVSNIGLVNASVTGDYSTSSLVGENNGTVQASYATGGSVVGNSNAGGLVGNNYGTIQSSYTNLQVSGMAGYYITGGLVGLNSSSGMVRNSFSTGQVAGGSLGGASLAGGLVGVNAGSIVSSFATGAVSGAGYVGGLVGQNSGGSIESAYAAGNVTGTNAIGGLVGIQGNNGSVYLSSARGSVSGSQDVGGLVGVVESSSYVSNSYAIGSVSGGTNVGGLVGRLDSEAGLTASYSSGVVTGSSFVGGFLGRLDAGGLSASRWDIQTSGKSDGVGSGGIFPGLIGLTTAQARMQSSYDTYMNFSTNWYMVDGVTRPFLRSEWSETITNAHQLQLMKLDLTAKYTLANDINLGAALAPVGGVYSGMWGAQGFSPIGSESAPLIGSLDGKGHTIDGLAMAPTSASVRYIGLFGAIGSAGVVQNLNLTNASITANPNYNGGGRQYVGVLAGENFGTVKNVTAQGTINGGAVDNLAVGGLVGRNGAFLSVFSPPQGLIQNSSANVAITTGDGDVLDANLVGGLVGDNPGQILSSSATGAINVGSYTIAGGLVGRNMIINGSGGPQPLIQDSWASGNVTSTGTNVGLGGLVGYNWGLAGEADSGMIRDSRATGNVTANAALSDPSCGFIVSCDFALLGGLVGFNQGFIEGTVTANVVPGLPSQGAGTYATGNVSVGSGGVAGGFVGQNDGIIDNALATGAVTGAAGLNMDRTTTLGGFAGSSNGWIMSSTATGNVGSANVFLQAGGFAGHSGGLIVDSHATGNVVTGDFSTAGGFASDTAPSDGTCFACNLGVGYNNLGVVTDSSATGTVTVGSTSAAGGFVAFSGDIANSTASGSVTGGGNSILGGFAAIVPTTDFLPYFVVNSQASGNVTSTGPNSWLGGFAGVNAGYIVSSSATGNVQATSDSVVGGFAGLNIGLIAGATTHGFSPTAPQSISVSGNNNLVGGLVGANFGAIGDSTSLVAITGNASNTMGTLVGANGNLADVELGQVPFSSFPLGTIYNSTGSGTINGGSGAQVGTFNLAKMPAAPAVLNACDETICEILKNPKTRPSDDDEAIDLKKRIEKEFEDEIDKVIQVITLLSDNNKTNQADSGGALITLPSSDPAGAPGGPGANVNTSSTNGSTGVRTASQTPGAPPPAPPPPPLRPVSGPDGERFSSIPPINENRFIQNEVVLQMGNNIPLADVQRIAQSMGLTIVSQQSLNALGRNAFRFSIGGGRSVRDVIRALEANSIVAVAQPNYQYKLSQSSAPASESKGDPAQYMVGKLQLEEVHRVVSGKNVTIAVIDSEADKQHTELQGQISEQFNAVGEAEKAHSHGTAMVGAIASRDRLLGVAPGAKILAVRAFSESQQSAEGTTFHILKSIDWAVSQGARVINMSFAGPRDPALERTLKKAYDQGVVLIAAAGNAGPKSPPLYPGADPSVIAVTATDAVDRGFKMANQGPHVSVASPGVDVLAPAPQESYQMSTGTSIATAHVSGVVALMLERDPTLTPADVRKILESTATDLGPKGKDTQFGWGLVNPQKALQLVDERKRKLTEAQPVITTASR